MSAFALDTDHDIFVTAGQLSRVTEIDEVVQKITTQLLHFLGEWWLDLNSGTPWFQSILGESPSGGEAESILKNVITNTLGVTELIKFKADIDSARALAVTFEAATEFGPTGSVTVSV